MTEGAVRSSRFIVFPFFFLFGPEELAQVWLPGWIRIKISSQQGLGSMYECSKLLLIGDYRGLYMVILLYCPGDYHLSWTWNSFPSQEKMELNTAHLFLELWFWYRDFTKFRDHLIQLLLATDSDGMERLWRNLTWNRGQWLWRWTSKNGFMALLDSSKHWRGKYGTPNH